MPQPTAQPADKTAITETVTRLFHAMDARDWETIPALFTDQIDVDHGSHQLTLSRQEYMARTKETFAGFDATQNLLGPIVVDLTAEDRATARFHARSTYLFTDVTEDPIYVIGAHYTVGLERPHDAWKIRSVELEEAYDEGDRALLEAAHQQET